MVEMVLEYSQTRYSESVHRQNPKVSTDKQAGFLIEIAIEIDVNMSVSDRNRRIRRESCIFIQFEDEKFKLHLRNETQAKLAVCQNPQLS